ncbi:unnamed protein product [Adineta ricciae]|uniref:Multiple inositol polyphosphate phosphatase 1 n=1 Tax=Adineta ricciae TaxID=249248 RepID=A0A814AI04_ADIRI|nr:unnamed protein product [Adineta ricciae]
MTIHRANPKICLFCLSNKLLHHHIKKVKLLTSLLIGSTYTFYRIILANPTSYHYWPDCRTQSLGIQEEGHNDLDSSKNENELDFSPITEKDDSDRFYSTKTSYKSPTKDYTLSSPPSGFKPICVQFLARHGSRTLTSHSYDIQTLKVWQLAKERNMLTHLGEQLKEDIERFMKENNQIGVGQLTELGRKEHSDMGARLVSRLPMLFSSSSTIEVVTSGKKRVVDSCQCFLSGLTRSQSSFQIKHEVPNKTLLYFHKSCSTYQNFKQTDPHIRKKIKEIKNLEQTRLLARQVLQRIYQDEFLQLLANENHANLSMENIDSINGTTRPNEVDAVLWLYAMFSVAPAHKESHLRNMLAKYFNREESNWFAYISDAQEYYIKGPSIKGTTATFDMARPLLIDFFSSIHKCIEDSSKAMVGCLRFAHAETIIPFASLLQIPCFSDQAVDLNEIYRYDNNSWRGAHISPMAANIQWEIYQNENDPHQILVRMLYNEMEVRFKDNCQSIAPDSYFYDFNELKRAYAPLLLLPNSELN